ncbi:unnamed protein product [Linum tenue]|uniref:Uncharacterized protein n=1 Tax=Linum tenue TaxID=586396 RepID=A0AAV0R9Y3_9ROSI|nr:unnamed protein product [Linum tenue]
MENEDDHGVDFRSGRHSSLGCPILFEFTCVISSGLVDEYSSFG